MRTPAFASPSDAVQRLFPEPLANSTFLALKQACLESLFR